MANKIREQLMGEIRHIISRYPQYEKAHYTSEVVNGIIDRILISQDVYMEDMESAIIDWWMDQSWEVEYIPRSVTREDMEMIFEDTVVWDGDEIRDGSEYCNSIIRIYIKTLGGNNEMIEDILRLLHTDISNSELNATTILNMIDSYISR